RANLRANLNGEPERRNENNETGTTKRSGERERRNDTPFYRLRAVPHLQSRCIGSLLFRFALSVRSFGSLFRFALSVRSFGSLLWFALMVRSCGSLLWFALMVRPYGSLL